MQRRILIVTSVIILIFLSACGSGQTVQNATPPPASTPTPEPTSTPAPTPTPVPTSTPAPTSIPGWSKMEADNVSIWLPDTYTGGDLVNDLDVVVSKLEALGPEYEQIAQTIEANPSLFLIWAVDSNIGSTGFLTNMNLSHEEVLSAVTLDMYVQAIEQQLPSSFTITDQKKVQIGSDEAARLEIEMNQSGITAKQLMYVIKNNSTLYNITYSTGLDEFTDRLPEFEQSANTFTIQP